MHDAGHTGDLSRVRCGGAGGRSVESFVLRFLRYSDDTLAGGEKWRHAAAAVGARPGGHDGRRNVRDRIYLGWAVRCYFRLESYKFQTSDRSDLGWALQC